MSYGRVVVLVVVCCFTAAAAGYAYGQATSGPPDSDVDSGFLADMTNHHEQGVQMAAIAVANAEDPTVVGFAKEVLITQQRQIGLMERMLADRGVSPPPGFDRDAMEWMASMPSTPVAEMPGMATEEQIDQLQSATGSEADLLFLELMREHHRGGLHMAEEAAERAADPEVRELAAAIAKTQTSEVAEYDQTIARLEGGG